MSTTYFIDTKAHSRWVIESEARGWLRMRCVAEDAENGGGTVGDTCKVRRKQLEPAGDEPAATKTGAGPMSALTRARANYVASKTAKGTKSLHNGDEVASALAGMPVEDVRAKVAAALGEDPARYDHLNAGQIRMNWGNRLRTAVRKGVVTLDALA